jgi:hypothetical protein
MNEAARLERGYRRLLAWYPRAFRQENSEEILAVLLACAQDGQRRPGVAASADLIKGAIRMRLRPPGRPPRAVTTAIRLMCAGAAAELAALITVIVTAGSVRSTVAHKYPGAAVAAQHVVTAHVVLDEIAMPVVAVVWLLLAWANSRGADAARAGFVAFFGLITVGLSITLAQGVAELAPADVSAAAVVWFIGLAASVLILTRASNRYYRPQAVDPAPWRGTFGTA